MFAIFLGFILALGVGIYIFLPYLLDWEVPSGPRKSSTGELREALMSQLADLEYDFRCGKIHEDEYLILRKEIEVTLIKIMESHHEAGDSDP